MDLSYQIRKRPLIFPKLVQSYMSPRGGFEPSRLEVKIKLGSIEPESSQVITSPSPSSSFNFQRNQARARTRTISRAIRFASKPEFVKARNPVLVKVHDPSSQASARQGSRSLLVKKCYSSQNENL